MTWTCTHWCLCDFQIFVREMPNYAEESVKIELKTNMWQQALEVCQLCVTHKQYLSATVMKEIVEIMMVNILFLLLLIC